MAKGVNDYLDGLEPVQRRIVDRLVEIVTRTVPDAELSIKWGQPVFTTKGPFCFIKPNKAHVNLGFWWGAKIVDPNGLLEGSGEKMRHVKIGGESDIDEALLAPLITEANRCNHELGDPTRTKA